MTFEDAYRDEAEAVRPSGHLMAQTLQAAQKKQHRPFRPWKLIPVVAAMLCIVLAVSFLRHSTPPDTIANQSGTETPTEGFVSISSLQNSQAVADVDGMTMRLLSTVSDGERSYILFELQGERVRQDMHLTVGLSNVIFPEPKLVLITPAAYDRLEHRAVFMVVFDNDWASWSEIHQQDGALNSAYSSARYTNSLTMSGGDTITLSIEEYSYQFSGAVGWLPDWEALGTHTSHLSNVNPSASYLQSLYEKEPLHVICDGYEIVSASYDGSMLHLLTRYHYDPDDVRAAEEPNYVKHHSLSLKCLSELLGGGYPGSIPVQASFVTHLDDKTHHCYYVDIMYRISPEELDGLGLWASASWEYGPAEDEDWSLTFTLDKAASPAIPATPTAVPETTPRPAVEIDLSSGTSRLTSTDQGVTLEVLSALRLDERTLQVQLGVSGEKVDYSALAAFDLPYVYASGFSYGKRGGSVQHPVIYTATIRAMSSLETLSEDNNLVLTMDQLELGVEEHRTVHEDIDLSAIPLAGLDEGKRYSYGRLPGEMEEIKQLGLATGETILSVGGLTDVTAMGFLPDGTFVIQTRRPANVTAGTLALVYLVPAGSTAPEQDRLDNIRSQSWYDENREWIFDEAVYDLTPEQLSSVQLYTRYNTIGETLAGGWSVSIDLSSVLPE